jgi:CheY-like chemotaxis protein
LFFPAPVRAVAPATFTPQPARTAVAVGRGQHILAVDDESTITALVGSVLNHLGYRSTVVQNPQEALDRFKLSPADFDCLLTDFSMPGMNGIDLANAMRIIRPDIPVVIMTGFLRAHDLAPLRDSGVHHLINKPFSMETLANKLSEVFRSAATAPLSSLD